MIDVKERTSPPAAIMPQASDRIRACREMLLKLGAGGNDPRWSSDIIDRLLTAAAAFPGNAIGDLFGEFFEILGENDCELTAPLANLIKDIVIACFTRYRKDYNEVGWERFVGTLTANSTQAQLYFALHAIPPHQCVPEVASAIVFGLQSTPYHREALTALAE